MSVDDCNNMLVILSYSNAMIMFDSNIEAPRDKHGGR